MSLPRKDLRKSRDWVEDQWIDIQVKPDVNSVLITVSKLSFFSTTSKNVKPDENVDQDNNMNHGTEQNSVDEVKAGPKLDGPNCILEVKDRIEGMEILPVEDACNREVGDHKISDSSGPL